MVQPEDYIRKKCGDPVDFAIVYHLYALRGSTPASAGELTHALKNYRVCENGHITPAQTCHECHMTTKPLLHNNPSYAEKTVRNHLSNLKSNGVVQESEKEPAGRKGRPPKVYSLSESFLKEIEEYLCIKEMTKIHRVCAFVVNRDKK